jgi:PAS domain S-box-containing protein
MKNLTSSPRIAFGFVAMLSISILNAVVASESINKISENNRLEIHFADVITVLNDLLDTVKDLQLEQREYVLTNNARYLESYRIDVTKLRDRLKLLADLKLEPQQLDPFRSTIDRKANELIATIDKRQLKTLTSAQHAELSQQGQQLINELRQTVTDLDRLEHVNLDRLQVGSRKSLADTKIAFGISGLLYLILLCILFTLVSKDLTKRQQAEAKLQDYVAEFEELYHSAPCGYHSLDADGKFIYINQTELQMLGYEADELIGKKSFGDLLTPESDRIFWENFSVAKQRGWIRDLEFQILHKDGSIVPVSATAIVLNDEYGNYLTSRWTTIEIGERLRLRQQARLSAEISQKIRQSLQLEEILQTVVDEVQKLLAVDRVLIFRLETDGSGTVLQERVLPDYPSVMASSIVNPGFDRAYHSKYQQGQIYSVADLTLAGSKTCCVEFLQEFGVKASAIVPIHLREELWGLLIVHQCRAPRHWQSNELEILARLATQLGIALAQAQLLESEQRQRQELTRSNAELEQFAYIASHDLQEPLRMVISYLQILERRYKDRLDDDAHEFIGYAVDGAVRMQSLIQALLSYARLSSRPQPFELVDTDRVLQDALANLQVAISESGAQITSAPLPAVWGDAMQLTQLFQNLIANAIKFRQRETPPQIEIGVRQVDLATQMGLHGDWQVLSPSTGDLTTASAWCFMVADNGIGIEERYRDRIFEIFRRLHPRSDYPGTGVGLAICKKIVERHGGKIWVESRAARSRQQAIDTATVTVTDELPQAIAGGNSYALSYSDRGSVFSFIIPEVGSNPPQNDDKSPHR